MPDRLYQLWAENLPQRKQKPMPPSCDREATRPEPSPSREGRSRFLPEAQVVFIPTPPKRHRGNHDS